MPRRRPERCKDGSDSFEDIFARGHRSGLRRSTLVPNRIILSPSRTLGYSVL